MTSEQSEGLPLPHTKGTKPAPLVVKVTVYITKCKRNLFHGLAQVMV
jgi:hypothetical protein